MGGPSKLFSSGDVLSLRDHRLGSGYRNRHGTVIEASDGSTDTIRTLLIGHLPSVSGIGDGRNLLFKNFFSLFDSPVNLKFLLRRIGDGWVARHYVHNIIRIARIEHIGDSNTAQVVILRPAKFGSQARRRAKPDGVVFTIVTFVFQTIGGGRLLGRDAQQSTRETKSYFITWFDPLNATQSHDLTEGDQRLLQRDVVNG